MKYLPNMEEKGEKKQRVIMILHVIATKVIYNPQNLPLLIGGNSSNVQ
jgi:hypothetical protein